MLSLVKNSSLEASFLEPKADVIFLLPFTSAPQDAWNIRYYQSAIINLPSPNFNLPTA